jgi:starch synthase
MNILFVASEVDPFAKTGGLADVAAALPKALAALGHDVRIVMPLYRQVNREQFGLQPTDVRVSIAVGPRTLEGRVWEASLPKGRVTTYLLDCPPCFDRDGLYQAQGQDHPDNLERFSFFAQAALAMLRALPWQPDIVHGHDWQAALACAHLRHGSLGQDPFFAGMGSVFTIHNLAYQGVFPGDQWPATSLPARAFSVEGLEWYGQVNCLKGGLTSAGVLTTVSPTYAREIQAEEFGCGLDGVLRVRRDDFVGILNGIDPEEWDPATDPAITATFSAERLEGKAQCKRALQRSQRLPERNDLLVGMVQRLADQKGIDIFVQAIDELMGLPLQIVILGTGDPRYHQQLGELAAQFPDRLAVNLTFDNTLAHRIEAGADAFLMPSRFEPCGLNQMYSMRFGTVPIVKRVGGLADTVVDATPSTTASKTATGFVFAEHSASALVETLRRVLAAFNDRARWTDLMRAGMRQDFSWTQSARAYVEVYQRALAKIRRRSSRGTPPEASGCVSSWPMG